MLTFLTTRMVRWYAVAALLAAGCFSTTLPAGAAEAVERVGKTVADFTLHGHNGREWSLHDFRDKPVVALVFLGTECPLAKLYAPRLVELQSRYADRGVALVAIDANTQDSITEMAAYAHRYRLNFPFLKDAGNRVADALQAERTPEVFLLDQERKVRYRGRIDDQYAVGVARDRVDRPHLARAIDELLEGKPVSVAETEPIGCFIGRVKDRSPQGEITYARHIAPIFNARCVECHRDGEIAPFSLSSYDDVIGWEDTIVEVIRDERMPPWFANPKYGKFHNDARLSEQEKQLIYQWVENGMPAGDLSELPPPPKFAAGWRIPKPDQVFYMRDKPFRVPAEGVVDYQHFIVDPGWKEDKYIYAAEARPDNTAVVHHILVYIIPPGARNLDLRTVLVGYAPGGVPVMLHDGMAVHVPAGSKLLFQMHYTPNGYEQEDRSYAGVCFIDAKDVKKLVRGRLAINTKFTIPPQARDYQVTADYLFHDDELLLAMTPHMHLRGKAFRYEAIYPDGKKEILLDVPKYDFNWQLKYILAEPKRMPKGTVIHCTATYDNSEDNLANPDPDRAVRWGEQSFEEMMIGFFDTVPVEEKHEPKLSKNVAVDPSGRWTWTRRQGSRTIEESLELQLRDQQLSGTLHTNGRSLPIRDAYVDGNRLRFRVTSRQFAAIDIAFDARVYPTRLEGEVTFTVDAVGQSRTFPWKAERATSGGDAP